MFGNVVDVMTRVTGEGLMAKDTGSGERPSVDEISRLAFHFYEQRGRVDGHDVEDWLFAEQELRHHYASPGSGVFERATTRVC